MPKQNNTLRMGKLSQNDDFTRSLRRYIYEYLDNRINLRLDDPTVRSRKWNSKLIIPICLSGNSQNPGLADMVIKDLKPVNVDYDVLVWNIGAMIHDYADWHRNRGEKVRLRLNGDVVWITVPLDTGEFQTKAVDPRLYDKLRSKIS